MFSLIMEPRLLNTANLRWEESTYKDRWKTIIIIFVVATEVLAKHGSCFRVLKRQNRVITSNSKKT